MDAQEPIQTQEAQNKSPTRINSQTAARGPRNEMNCWLQKAGPKGASHDWGLTPFSTPLFQRHRICETVPSPRAAGESVDGFRISIGLFGRSIGYDAATVFER